MFDEANYKPVLVAQKTNTFFATNQHSNIESRASSPFQKTQNRFITQMTNTNGAVDNDYDRDDSKCLIKIELGEDERFTKNRTSNITN